MTTKSLLKHGIIVLLIGLVLVPPSPPVTLFVTAGMDAQEALDTAPSGATLELGPGVHRGPLRVERTVTIRGPRAARVVAPISADAALHLRAPDTTVSGLTVEGGWTGIDVDDAPGTLLHDVAVRGADAQGIRIYKSPATVESASVGSLRNPHAQGIEVLSAEATVRGARVSGGKVGIVGHLSRVTFEDNVVSDTAQVGIMIREMSSGAARDNVVVGATGAGLYCGDMSLCEFAGNKVTRVAAGDSGRSEAGWGLVVHYHAAASSHGDVLQGVAGDAVALSGSRIAARSPLERGGGAASLVPAAVSSLLSFVALGLLFTIGRRILPAPAVERRTSKMHVAGVWLVLAGLFVQSFHMLEHVVQLSRVRLDGVPSRGSLVGSVVDTEWVHFTYNVLVLFGMAALLLLRHRGWTPPGNGLLGDRLLFSAGALQAYHVIEHSAKVVQHTLTGAKVNPGLLGEHVDLVILHFGLNLAIYLGFAAAAVAYLWRSRTENAATAAGRVDLRRRLSQPRPERI